jgi:hypothetical protein
MDHDEVKERLDIHSPHGEKESDSVRSHSPSHKEQKQKVNYAVDEPIDEMAELKLEKKKKYYS